MQRCCVWGVGLGLWLIGCAVPAPSAYETAKHHTAGTFAFGVVYDDANHNGRRDHGERGIADVGVSNGRTVVTTDRQGRYAVPVDDDTIVFIIKPAGWMTPTDRFNLPTFYYIHKPNGSPPSRYPGVAPTGPLPESIDFPLHACDEPDTFRVVLFGDPQPYVIEEVDFLAHDVVEELIGVDATFGVSLGDLVGDDLSLFEPLNATVRHIGLPWYNVIGNHDLNFDAPDDEHSDETYERVFGPPCYAFNYARVHFIVLDDVAWSGASENEKGSYTGMIGPQQLAFIKNDLALVPRDHLVVLMMHIPLTSVEDRAELMRLLSDRPHTVSIAAHHHRQHHDFLDHDHGWTGEHPHHHFTNATTSGSWWRGHRDEENIPHATMRDGAPNGYSIITFQGNEYSVRFKAARRPADHQMTIFAPDAVTPKQAADTEIIVNVFAGSERSKVEMRFGDDGPWQVLDYKVGLDPYYQMLVEAEGPESQEQRPLPKIYPSRHLWTGRLPADPPVGSHAITVRATDMFGQVDVDHRIIRVVHDARR